MSFVLLNNLPALFAQLKEEGKLGWVPDSEVKDFYKLIESDMEEIGEEIRQRDFETAQTLKKYHL